MSVYVHTLVGCVFVTRAINKKRKACVFPLHRWISKEASPDLGMPCGIDMRMSIKNLENRGVCITVSRGWSNTCSRQM